MQNKIKQIAVKTLVLFIVFLCLSIGFMTRPIFDSLTSPKTIIITNSDIGKVEEPNNIEEPQSPEFSVSGVVSEKEEEVRFGDSPSSSKVAKVTEIDNEIEKVFGEHSEMAKAIAKAESGLDPNKESDIDRMKDGRTFSVGLYQINLTVHEIAGKKCHKAFRGRNYDAVVIDEGLYKECVTLAKNASVNLKKAKSIFDRSNWYAWGVYQSGAHLKFM